MKRQALVIRLLVVLGLAGAAGAGEAAELFGGVHIHDVDTALTKGGFERGVDFQIGWRGERIGALRAIGAPAPHAFVSVNSAGDTNFAAAGVSWKIGGTLYFRPGVGIAIHDRPSRVVAGNRRIDFGSRILFAPELGIGYRLSDRVSLEASWIHLSHAQLFGRQNPGLDNFGIRMNYRFR
ncbi:MAG: acyloxyacyl hydrolase [Pseudomonadota bacterium]|nr:acyloxyacyl hydrolase [Pseudomonadota bacterium]